MDSQHGGQRIGRASSLGTALGVVGLNQIDECLPRHNHLHLSQELLPLGALLGRGLLVITKPKLLATHEPRPGQRSGPHCPVIWLGFPGSP